MLSQETRERRLKVANQVLSTLGNYELSFDRGFYLSWINWRGNKITKRWSSSVNFHPPFHKQIELGGTGIIAITQLVRYCQGKTVLPITTWKYWGSDHVKLWKSDDQKEFAITSLQSSDYPSNPTCVFCGADLTGDKWDWYYLPKEGVGCLHKSQCINNPVDI